ncbi:MAG: hypothetical protein LWX83_18220, partial [Anaerolineae bacterium]|nr:hypothetical protein [Anaerolineae bacterium]
YLGQVDSNGNIINASATPMRPIEKTADDFYIFEDPQCRSNQSGLHGYTIRIIPSHPDLTTTFLPGLIYWA